MMPLLVKPDTALLQGRTLCAPDGGGIPIAAREKDCTVFLHGIHQDHVASAVQLHGEDCIAAQRFAYSASGTIAKTICAYEHGSEQARARGRDKVDLFALIHFLVKNTNEAAFFVDFGADGRLPNHSVITREISDQLDGELMHLYSHAYLHPRACTQFCMDGRVREHVSACTQLHADKPVARRTIHAPPRRAPCTP